MAVPMEQSPYFVQRAQQGLPVVKGKQRADFDRENEFTDRFRCTQI